MAWVHPDLDEIVAGLPAVNAEVRRAAEAGKKRIQAAIAPHSKTGHLYSSVEVNRANDKDYWIDIGARYAVPANYGHFNHWAGRWVEGINFIKAVAG